MDTYYETIEEAYYTFAKKFNEMDKTSIVGRHLCLCSFNIAKPYRVSFPEKIPSAGRQFLTKHYTKRGELFFSTVATAFLKDESNFLVSTDIRLFKRSVDLAFFLDRKNKTLMMSATFKKLDFINEFYDFHFLLSELHWSVARVLNVAAGKFLYQITDLYIDKQDEE